MDTAVETPVVTESPTPAPEPTPVPEATSVADHAAKFGPQALEDAAQADNDDAPAPGGETPAQAALRARDDQGRFARERHRARSDRARPEDVPRIQKLTAKLRETERRLAEVEARTTTQKAETPIVPPAPREVPPPSTSAFAEREPTLEDFANEADPYTAYNRALGRYDRRKEAFESQQAQAQAATQQASTQADEQVREWWAAADSAFGARKQEFVGRTPDYQAKVDALVKDHGDATPLLLHAVLVHDKGPELVYYLATHPSVYDEMLLLTDGKAITEQSVALTQRQLAARSQTAQTGSVTAAPYVSTVPKPPNPVRTGPMKSGDDSSPGDGHSIADHARHWGPRTRR